MPGVILLATALGMGGDAAPVAPAQAIVDFSQIRQPVHGQPYFALFDVDVLHFIQLPFYEPPPRMIAGKWIMLDHDKKRDQYFWGSRGYKAYQYVFAVTNGSIPPQVWLINLLLARNAIVFEPGFELVTVGKSPIPERVSDRQFIDDILAQEVSL